MPIYQYHCNGCGSDLEIFQRMTDPTLTACPQCEGELRKIFSPVGIVFKGSGFYATDSKKSNTSSRPAAPATTETAAKTEVTPASVSETTTTKTETTAATSTPAATSAPTPAA